MVEEPWGNSLDVRGKLNGYVALSVGVIKNYTTTQQQNSAAPNIRQSNVTKFKTSFVNLQN